MRNRYLIYIFSALMLASCMTDDANDPMEDTVPTIKGTISDQLGKPIEHIMVKLSWGSGREVTTVYTSSEGIFKTEIPYAETWVDILISDVDGQDNGGEFETLTDKVMIYDKADIEGLQVIILDYHLNPSTPSENSPQS